MLSNKTKYAIMALTMLAREYGKEPIQISEIAVNQRIPRRFLENILLELKKMGILGSKLGKSGGYYLLKKPSEVSLSDVIRPFEGTIALVHCVSERQYRPCELCADEAACKPKLVFKEIRDTTFGILERATLDTLI